MITRNVFRQVAILSLILALSSFVGSTAHAQNESTGGINTGHERTCSTTTNGTTIEWQGNQVLSIADEGVKFAVRQVNRADFGSGLVITTTLPACNIGFTPNYDAVGCTTGPQIAKHAATAGISSKGVQAITDFDSALWKYFAGYGENSNEPGTVLFRIGCPQLEPTS